MTKTAEPIQDGIWYRLFHYDIQEAFPLWQSKDESCHLNHHLRQRFEELVERYRLYEVLKAEKRPWAVRLTLANMWRLTRLEGQPGVILHTFDLAEGCWREQDPEVITWRNHEHGLRRPNGSETIWPDLKSSYHRMVAPDPFKNLMVAWLEKVRPALSGNMEPGFPPEEDERFAAFIYRRLVELPFCSMAGNISLALHQHIWSPKLPPSMFPLAPHDVRGGLSRHLGDQSADLARINRESPNLHPLLNFIPPAWWSRRDLFQDKVLKAASPVFKSFSPAGLRWLRRLTANDLSYFNYLFDYRKSNGHSEAAILSTAGEMAEVMAGLPPRAAGLPELTGTIFDKVWRLLLKLRGNIPTSEQILVHRLARLLARHILTSIRVTYKQYNKQYYWEGDEAEMDEIDNGLRNDMDAIIDWFRAEGHQQYLPDKNSTWLSLKRRSERWHREVWRRKRADEANATWKSRLGEMTIDGIKIKPLITGLDLHKEGHEMRHCVGSYARLCLRGHRIFSLLEADGTRSTLSLRPKSDGFAIDQHKGLDNGPVSPASAKAAREICRLYNLKHWEAMGLVPRTRRLEKARIGKKDNGN